MTRKLDVNDGAPSGHSERPERSADRRRDPDAARRLRALDQKADCVATRFAVGCDAALDFLVVSFASWTVIYHVCLAARIGTGWAAAAGALALVPAAWFAVLRASDRIDPSTTYDTPLVRDRTAGVVLAVNAAAAAAAAALFAFTSTPWPLVWLVWILAAGAGVLATWTRARPVPDEASAERTTAEPPAPGRRWPAAATAIAWALALATVASFLVDHDGDDTQYVHMSAWVAAYGEFPLRDILFSNQELPAVIFPWLSSWEGLLGTLARITGIWAPDLVYLGVPPIASVLSVLATWRLLRRWRLRMTGVALSVAMLFLFMSSHDHRTLGSFFVGRIWQGKVVFLAILIPVLLALLVEYAERPTRGRLVLLAAAGVAAVGFTSSGVFVVPVIAAGFFAPLVFGAAKEALAGLATTVAYPLLMGITTLAVGGHNAKVYVDAAVAPTRLVEREFGVGVLAAIGITAMLVGPAFIRHAVAARSTAATTSIVTCLFAPAVPLFVLHATGLGGVLWRWMWAVPVAPLLGVLATNFLGGARAPAIRVAPSVALCAVLVVWGSPLWPGRNAPLAEAPAWKRPPQSVKIARAIYPHLRPRDRVAAPGEVLRTLLVMSGTITAVTPRRFYTTALRGVPGGHVEKQLLVRRLAQRGIGRPTRAAPSGPYGLKIARALEVLDVDVVCVTRRTPHADRLLRGLGYTPFVRARTVSCLRAPNGHA